jgi:hypothetical protein
MAQLRTDLEGPIDGDRLVLGVKQGAAGNCASLAAIKAAIAACWPEPVLLNVREQATEVSFKMRDNMELEYRVNREEIVRVGSAARFAGKDTALVDHVRFLYAAMIARAKIEDSTHTEDQLIEDLNDGEYYRDTPDFLGLESWKVDGPGRLRPARRNGFLRAHVACIAANAHHAWFVTYGHHDQWGTVDMRERASHTLALIRPDSG